MESINSNDVLTLDDAYFQLKTPFERRLYEICRKRCGKQPSHKIKLDNLRERIGIRLSLAAFRGRLIKSKKVLEYRIRVECDDVLIFRDSDKGRQLLGEFEIKRLKATKHL